MLKFNISKPEDVGIDERQIINIIERLDKQRINMHSLLILKGNNLICEAYWKPYNNNMLHRMFSISKSFTAIAIGFLLEEGKFDLDDAICDYFPEYIPNDVHPWIKSMTIRDCLMMRTCHASTTYKNNMHSNWVESFFTTPPTHPSGRYFCYDTSSAHTLCALVEKLTNMKMLDYIKQKLSLLGLSEESYMLSDPFGVSMGGSGLVATSLDMLKFGYFLKQQGNIGGQQLIDSSYIRECTSFLSDTRMTAPVSSEAVGYGMMIWQNERQGFVCYGMGGQFIIELPKQDMLIVTTADTIGRAGANQIIYETIYSSLCDGEISHSAKSLSKILPELSMHSQIPIPNTPGTKSAEQISPVYKKNIKGHTYHTSGHAFDNIMLSINDDVGRLTYTLNGSPCQLDFGFGRLIEGQFPLYDMHYAASGIWVTEDTLYIRLHIIDEYIGSVHIQLSFDNDSVAVFMKKNEESLFNEYNGHVYGKYTKTL
ncbi:MAG: beta-lactamase family protein [Pseudobutyrivibrio sp.]|nr:beta-lactamase family protein [Pseudobutyrivibrio sp.]